MEEKNIRYPIGQQDFKMLREGDALYVDKTAFVEKIANSNSKYYFLARPPQFGKSLFLSTLQYFFEGKRELFKGLYIDSTDWNWESYPVLRLDLNSDSYDGLGMLDGVLDNLFREWEKKYDVEVKDEAFSQRFKTIIRSAHEKTGKRVVILVDEYDKPLIGNINKEAHIDHYRNKLAAIYSNFKNSAEHIRLVFMSGVSRFGGVGFSELNNLRDISFLDEFADICGITEREFLQYFKPGISQLAEKEGVSFEEACDVLKRNYGGYRFAKGGSDIYNPWSLLNAMENLEIGNYCNDMGMPKIVTEALQRVHANLEEIFDTYCTADDLKSLDLLRPQSLALLYQTGYLTIKNYLPKIKRYHLGIPNHEVKDGLFKVLLKSQSDKDEKHIVGDMGMYSQG